LVGDADDTLRRAGDGEGHGVALGGGRHASFWGRGGGNQGRPIRPLDGSEAALESYVPNTLVLGGANTIGRLLANVTEAVVQPHHLAELLEMRDCGQRGPTHLADRLHGEVPLLAWPVVVLQNRDEIRQCMDRVSAYGRQRPHGAGAHSLSH